MDSVGAGSNPIINRRLALLAAQYPDYDYGGNFGNNMNNAQFYNSLLGGEKESIDR